MSELTKGTRLADRYTLEARLGRGGDAATWLAKDRLTRASVALKIVPASGAARLRDEWQTNLRLMHAHIVRVFEFHEDQGFAFYSMQFIDGADIGAIAGNELEDVLPPVGLLADALRYSHAKDVVHRDVKASNVLLDHNGVPYLTDFGVAAAIGNTAGGGSPIGTSPQARRGEPASPADDIYALGVLIHELVAGVPPEEGVKLAAASGQAIPGTIATLVEHMLDQDAAKRPAAAEVIDTLAGAGYKPGPARSQVTARPVLQDQEIERVTAVAPSSIPETGTPDAATGTSSGLNPRLVATSLVVLVSLLLGVVFLLPDAVDEKPSRTQPTPAEPIAADQDPVAADVVPEDPSLGRNRVTREYVPENEALDGEDIQFNENDADYTGLDDEGKQRFNVESILGELLSDFETLERRGVQRWAPVPYKRAQEFYKTGDEAYLRKDWSIAEVNYLDALTLLKPLFEQVEPEFEKALSGAKAAFEAGDRTEALRLYELAVAITPNHPEARAGLERAQNLEAVLQLVDRGLAFEEELELDAAEASFRQAVELDPNWGPAKDGLERVRATRTKIQFDSRMSEGLDALAATDYLAARAAFRMAQQLIPGSPEPADGLLQVDQGLRLDRIVTLEQEAQSLEASEHWDAAVTTYEEILAIDENLAFAIDGRANARRMTTLHQQLDDYIKEPDRLSVPSVMDDATKLVIRVTTMGDIGPRLAGQRDELSRLLKRAATPVSVELVSDNQTAVSIYKVGALGRFTSRRLELRPGTYVAVGARPGYRDVRLEFQVAPESDMQPVVVRCEERI
jgi:serine/threonine protein kinase/tetratricopeptide (TPR) repeat protein